MAKETRRRPRRLVEPAALVEISLWDMLEAAMATDSAPAPPTKEKAAEIPTDALAAEPAPRLPRRARRRAALAGSRALG
jgi:hypothetical protein